MSQTMWVPKYAFLCAGSGSSPDHLQAFELALLDCGPMAHNLVTFSSIIPPFCEVVSAEEGFKMLTPGQITFCVMAIQETNKKGGIVSASIGLARLKNPKKDPTQFGYMSEFHSGTVGKEEAASEARRLAKEMLARRMETTPQKLDLEIDKSIASSIENKKEGDWACALALGIVVL